MSEERKEPPSTWPVVVHKSLTNPGVTAALKQKNFIIKTSDGVVPGSVIFPLSAGVAFLIVSLDQVIDTEQSASQKHRLSQEFIDRLDKFVQSHKHCFLLCKAVIHGDTEKNVYSLIQQHYLLSRLRMMPVHNIQEAMVSMLTIAKGLCKPSEELLYRKLEGILLDLKPATS